MAKHLINLGIIEPSHIIYEGLANILLRSMHHFQLYRPDNIEELEHADHKYSFDVIIVNPICIQHNIRSFSNLKRTRTRIVWIALVYAYFDKEILSQFDNIIQITDSSETIINTIYRQVQTSVSGAELPAGEHISERETDVLKLLVQGLSNKEIADKLNISIHTVVSHRKNIIQKTGIKSQAGLTIYAISNKLISIDLLSSQ